MSETMNKRDLRNTKSLSQKIWEVIGMAPEARGENADDVRSEIAVPALMVVIRSILSTMDTATRYDYVEQIKKDLN